MFYVCTCIGKKPGEEIACAKNMFIKYLGFEMIIINFYTLIMVLDVDRPRVLDNCTFVIIYFFLLFPLHGTC